MKHKLKIWKEHFVKVKWGHKKFELRKNDRNFQEGDLLILQEYDLETDTYSGREITVEVTSILEDFQGIEKGYCIMSIVQIIIK